MELYGGAGSTGTCEPYGLSGGGTSPFGGHAQYCASLPGFPYGPGTPFFPSTLKIGVQFSLNHKTH